MELNVSTIQHFSTGDGPGIRTTVFLKGCHLHCPWCHNPETLSPKPQTLIYPARTVSYGKRMTAKEVADEIREDLDFYIPDGGVTISGGEPLLQSEAVLSLCRLLQKDHIPIIIDTAGDVPWEAIMPLIPYVDGWFFDCKTADNAAYRKIIGADSDRIFDNLRRLIAAGASIRVRIPLIPGFNTASETIDAIIRRLVPLGVTQVDLLPFHRMADGKYRALEMEYAYRDIEPLSKPAIESIKQQYRTAFTVTVEA